VKGILSSKNGMNISGGVCTKNETTTYSKDPYGIYFTVHGFENKHISFTIKNIDIRIKNGENLSHLFYEDYSNKIFLKSESETVSGMLWWGHYHTEPIFNFKRKPVIIEVTFEIEETDKIETKVITYELTPEEKWGLFQMID
jgi:hypothetical protein